MRKITQFKLELRSKAVFVFLISLFISSMSVAQTFYTETFDGTACPATSGCDPSLVGWTSTSLGAEGSDANKWYVSCQENGNAAGACGSACGSDQSLHVGNVSTSSAAALFCPSGDCGAAYDDSSPAEATNKRVESPVISCAGKTNITIAFNYLEKGEALDDDASLVYFDGTSWSSINALAKTTTCGGGQGKWTAFSMALPASADNNSNVKIGFVWKNDGDGNASDPSFAVDDITLSVTSSANTITTGTITGSPFCACGSVNVPFTSTGTFTAGNIYTAQLSNAAGSFAAPTSIGTLTSTANSGTITATIPCGTATGSGYRIRVISSTPSVTGSDNGVNITINATVTPSVSITASPAGAICAGTSVTFTATPTNGGTTPTYQWQINGSNVGGATSSTFTSSTLTNGNVVTVVMTSNVACPTSATATSSGITMTVNPTVTPSVSIAASPAGAICAGTSVTFTATPTNGGTTPTYQWQINGSNVGGATSSTFTSTTLANNDNVTVVMTSNATCPSPATATSSAITMTVNPSVTPSVSVAASPAGAVCAGTSVTFTATPTNGGTTPTYQWQINGSNVGGATSSTFTSTTLANGDNVTVIMTSNATCPSTPTATSPAITMTVNPAVTPSVSITSNPSPAVICAGDPISFTATPTNGGTTPAYQWQVNGTNVGGATSATFAPATLSNGDAVTVIMTSNAACASPLTATSNTITITVSASVTASVSISSTGSTICAGDAVTFTATPTNGGSAPTYQWQVNGTNVGGATASTFTSSALVNGDDVTVIMTSNSGCATGSPATSNTITITVSGATVASVNIAAAPAGAICAGTSVTFTATPTNGGSTPTYQWQINGSNVGGATSSTFTSTTLANGDAVTVIMTSSSSCATGSPATSNSIAMTVNPAVAASVNIVSNPTPAVICAGASVTFTATPTNGGTTPTYQWQVNGSNAAGATSATFTSSTLANNDVVTVIMTSNAACVTGSPATSNSISVTVNPSVTASVAITSSPTPAVICAGASVTFTATPTNGGTTPTYQWQVNGTNAAGATSATFTSSTLANNDAVTVIMTSNAACVTGSPATSAAITVTVNPSVTPAVSITSAPSGTICSGQSVTFTATPANGGTTPTYQWQVNGTNVAGATAATFTSSTLTNGNTVTVVLTSNAACATPATATSNTITMVVSSSVTPSVTITGTPSAICAGDPVTFTATPVNGGTTPTYQWMINGTNAGSGTSSFTTSSLTSGDVVTVSMTSNAACASPSSATSNPVTTTVTNCNPPVAAFSGTPTVMCEAGCVSFTDLSTNSPTSWTWSFPGATPSSSTVQHPSSICYSADGTYAVTLAVANASGRDTLVVAGYITVGAPVTVNITGNMLITSCEETVLTASPNDGSYVWGPSATLSGTAGYSVTAKPTQTQQYYVTYTSPEGCTDSDTATVVVEDLNTYFLPTGFTPNGDGVNDEVHLHGRGIESFTLKIFDRIGEKVFETSDIDKGWDGKLHGLPMNDGVFVYVLDISFCNGEVKKVHGDITLVK